MGWYGIKDIIVELVLLLELEHLISPRINRVQQMLSNTQYPLDGCLRRRRTTTTTTSQRYSPLKDFTTSIWVKLRMLTIAVVDFDCLLGSRFELEVGLLVWGEDQVGGWGKVPFVFSVFFALPFSKPLYFYSYLPMILSSSGSLPFPHVPYPLGCF